MRLLAEGKLYAADENLNKLKSIYFPIIKIIREEIKDQIKEYEIGKYIKIFINGQKATEIPSDRFNNEADSLLNSIKNAKGKRAFTVEKTEKFMNEIQCFKLSAPPSDKSDITMKILDINTGYSPIVGFSIKSGLGSSSTLLNAGRTTNFIYRIIHKSEGKLQEANDIYTVTNNKNHINVKGRIAKICEGKGKIHYFDMENKVFKDNLVLIDSNMDIIISHTLLYYYKDNIINCKDMIKRLEEENPMNYGNINAYRFKYKKFLTSVALGMKPATKWDGIDEASGGYIIVTRDGDVLAYHIYNRNYFEEYLLNNTKYDTASTSRHKFGNLYEEDGKTFIKLNLQIRFI